MATYDLIIRNGNLVMFDSIVQGDIAIKEGKIKEVTIGKNIDALATREINAEGQRHPPRIN